MAVSIGEQKANCKQKMRGGRIIFEEPALYVVAVRRVASRSRQTREQISLTVSSGQLAAKTLYRSFGFETFGYERGALKIAEQYFDEEYMALWLG